LFFRDCVLILFNETFRVVGDVESIMTNGEAGFSEPGFLVESVVFGSDEILVQLVYPSLIGSGK
jgi:hypothetical protein